MLSKVTRDCARIETYSGRRSGSGCYDRVTLHICTTHPVPSELAATLEDSPFEVRGLENLPYVEAKESEYQVDIDTWSLCVSCAFRDEGYET